MATTKTYDLLEAYPVTDWNGGRVRVIRDHVLHLTRGQRFSIDGKSFFTMGGAACHDIQNGVLDPADDHFESRFWELRNQGKFFRVPASFLVGSGIAHRRGAGRRLAYARARVVSGSITSSRTVRRVDFKTK